MRNRNYVGCVPLRLELVPVAKLPKGFVLLKDLL